MRQTNGIMTSTCTTFAMGRIFRGATAGRVIVRTYIPDHPGSTAAIFEDGRMLTEENDYYPSGMRQNSPDRTKSADNRWRFCRNLYLTVSQIPHIAILLF